MHLAAQKFIQFLKPRAMRSTRNGTATVEDIPEDDENEDDWAGDHFNDDEEIDDVIEYLPGDLLGKILGLVNQV